MFFLLLIVLSYSAIGFDTTKVRKLNAFASSKIIILKSMDTHHGSTAKVDILCDNSQNKIEHVFNSILRLDLNLMEPLTVNEISNQNLIKIVNLECSDLDCCNLAWKCLGYKYDETLNKFVLTSNVFPKWAAKYPHPPDLIGLTRNYSSVEIDKPVRDASMNLMRSIPRNYKGGVRELEKEGFRGYKLKELTPNKTRRAQLVNWIIYYREKLYGKTLEELKAERLLEEIKSKEQASLPSERNYEKLRLDGEDVVLIEKAI